MATRGDMEQLPFLIKYRICQYLLTESKHTIQNAFPQSKHTFTDINQTSLVSRQWNEAAVLLKWQSCDLFAMKFQNIKQINSKYRSCVKEPVISNYDTTLCEKLAVSLLLEFTRYTWPNLETIKIYATGSTKVAAVSLQFLVKSFSQVKSISIFDGLQVPGIYKIFSSNLRFSKLKSLVLKNTFDTPPTNYNSEDFFLLLSNLSQITTLCVDNVTVDYKFLHRVSSLSDSHLTHLELHNSRLCDNTQKSKGKDLSEAITAWNPDNSYSRSVEWSILSSYKHAKVNVFGFFHNLKTLKFYSLLDLDDEYILQLEPVLFPSLRNFVFNHQSFSNLDVPASSSHPDLNSTPVLDRFFQSYWPNLKKLGLPEIDSNLAAKISVSCPNLESLSLTSPSTSNSYRQDGPLLATCEAGTEYLLLDKNNQRNGDDLAEDQSFTTGLGNLDQELFEQ